ncbi:hypothetical protein CWM47_31660 [Spirosoma pollinicola]|uniref:Uncharacterized protein n=2 Tax=Spirosoma pollinicola TaxID=2057025 RepID=A0A2K8Z807_9BACT|nr:hypothetical protein CWM47_31660 [Spirosoma pollinicola]
MFGYDGPTVNGNFKNTITKLLNQFDNPQATSIFIVNDKVYPYPKSYSDLIKSATLFQYKTGNAAYTDFGQIFQTIADDLEENQLAILTTDLIYSEKSATGQNAAKIMATAQNLAQIALKNYTKTGSLLVLKLHSDYSGRYYPYNSPQKGKQYKGDRPFYVLLFAKNATMDRLLTENQYAGLRNFSSYPSFENQYLFSSSTQARTPFYTLLENHPSAKGTYDKDREGDNSKGLHIIKNVEPPHKSTEKLTIVVAVKLPVGAYGEVFIRNPANYTVESIKDNFKIKAIQPSTNPGTTHDIILEASSPASGERTAIIRLKRIFPPTWIISSSSDDDTNVNPNTTFATTTFGLQPMMTGIHHAYEAHITDKNYLFSLSLHLND